jgi:hypothetical protein
MCRLLTLAVVALASLFFASSSASAQQPGFGAPMNYGSTRPYVYTPSQPVYTRGFGAPAQASSRVIIRQTTPQDMVNARAWQYQQRYPTPLDYPPSAERVWQDNNFQRAERDVYGNNYRPSRSRAVANAILLLFGMGGN